MPTAPKIVAAVLFAIVAGLAAHLFIPALPEGTQVKLFREISAAVGFFVGWRVMGRLTGKGYVDAAGSGVRTSVTILFWLLLGFSIYTMVKRSTKMLYDDPMEAVTGVFDLMLYFGKFLAEPATPVALLIGGVMGGVVTEWASRRWS